MVLENNITKSNKPTTDYEINKVITQLQAGKEWRDLFPGIATLQMDAIGSGLTYSLRLTKKEGLPVRPLQEGEDPSKAIIYREVNPLDRYSLNITKVAEKLGITVLKACALVEYLKIQNNEEYFKEFVIGKQRFKRYHPNVIPYLKEKIKKINMDIVWQEYRRKHYGSA